MKYISVLILLGLFAWTWSLATAQPSVASEQRHHVELGVLQDVSAFIQQRFPKVADVICHQLYVELGATPETMTAHFRCNAVGDLGNGQNVDQVFEGHLNLKSDDGFQTWSEVGGTINSSELEFTTPAVISTHGNGK
jgi:hypothetical protein